MNEGVENAHSAAVLHGGEACVTISMSRAERADLGQRGAQPGAARRRTHAMSGRPFLWTRQQAGRLSGWRICSGSTRLMDAHPILNGSLKDIDVYD